MKSKKSSRKDRRREKNLYSDDEDEEDEDYFYNDFAKGDFRRHESHRNDRYDDPYPYYDDYEDDDDYYYDYDRNDRYYDDFYERPYPRRAHTSKYWHLLEVAEAERDDLLSKYLSGSHHLSEAHGDVSH